MNPFKNLFGKKDENDYDQLSHKSFSNPEIISVNNQYKQQDS